MDKRVFADTFKEGLDRCCSQRPKITVLEEGLDVYCANCGTGPGPQPTALKAMLEWNKHVRRMKCKEGKSNV
jgi:hypothetical protein